VAKAAESLENTVAEEGGRKGEKVGSSWLTAGDAGELDGAELRWRGAPMARTSMIGERRQRPRRGRWRGVVSRGGSTRGKESGGVFMLPGPTMASGRCGWGRGG
jgi:hypothetical protein